MGGGAAKKGRGKAPPKDTVAKLQRWGIETSTRSCPIMFTKDSKGKCQRANPQLAPWCLTPMQKFNGKRLFDFIIRRNRQGKTAKYKTFTRQTGPQPVFGAFVKPSDVPLRFKLTDYLMHKGNRWAVKVGEPRSSWTPAKDLDKMFNFKSCAVVGSSNSLLKAQKGKDIDKHTAVIRMNQAPTKGFEAYTGKKTTVRLQNQERVGPHPGEKNSVCLVKGYNFRKPKGCKVLPLSPQFLEYTKFHWVFQLNSRFFDVKRATRSVGRMKMSTGFMAITLAMHVCRRVDIYGFSGKSSHYYTKTAAKKSDSTQFNMRHPWPLERACLKSLSKLDGVTVWS